MSEFKNKPECGRNQDGEIVCKSLQEAKAESWRLLASGAAVRVVDGYDGSHIVQKLERENHGFRWEGDPVGLPFKIALQLRFREMSQDAAETRDLSGEGLTRESVFTWARRWAPFIEDYYFKKTGQLLTGKALYQLVLNAKFYSYDKATKKGYPKPGPSYLENRPEWCDLVDAVDQISGQATQEHLRAIGAPYLAWLARFDKTRKPEPKHRLL